MKTMETKGITQQLSTLLRKEMDIPVFEETLPEGFSCTCLVVRQELYDSVSGRGEYHINVYVPNKLRILGCFTDRTYPDTDGIDALGDRVLAVCEGLHRSFPNIKIHTRKYIRGGGMHYLSICLWGIL